MNTPEQISEEQPLGVGLIGSWTMEANHPYGFVIRNIDPNSCETEYHFHHQSNGWVTTKGKNAELKVFTPFGLVAMQPQLVDKLSTKKLERIQDLKSKGRDLTDDECRELLVLIGFIPGKE